MGWLDAQGRLNLTGRSKDLIIRSGHNIDPKGDRGRAGCAPAVHLCAAVGAPDAYAGELPVVYATLVPGASASAEELISFAAQRVDEAPARPKAVTIIDHMPMTNVGKIYKPELRLLAAKAVVTALVHEVCSELAFEDAARALVEADAEHGVTVFLDARPAGGASDRLEERLRPSLARLPIKTQLARQ